MRRFLKRLTERLRAFFGPAYCPRCFTAMEESPAHTGAPLPALRPQESAGGPRAMRPTYSLLFALALWIEARAVHLRDWAQRRKMACVRGTSDTSW